MRRSAFPFLPDALLSVSFANPFYTSLRYSVALLFPAAPFHIIAQPFNAAALHFLAIPSLYSSLLFRIDASLRHSFTKQFVAFPSQRVSFPSRRSS
jgi:hypothetical protein